MVFGEVTGTLMVDYGMAARQVLVQEHGIASAHIWLVDDLLVGEGVKQVLAEFMAGSFSDSSKGN